MQAACDAWPPLCRPSKECSNTSHTQTHKPALAHPQKTGGNWIAAAQDLRGRVYIIDQAGDLYYDSGNPDIGIYAVCLLGVYVIGIRVCLLLAAVEVAAATEQLSCLL